MTEAKVGGCPRDTLSTSLRPWSCQTEGLQDLPSPLAIACEMGPLESAVNSCHSSIRIRPLGPGSYSRPAWVSPGVERVIQARADFGRGSARC